MRVLSARILRARRNRATDRIDAVVALMVLIDGANLQTNVQISAPGRAPGAAPLRDRLLGAAKLAFVSGPGFDLQRSAA